MRVFLIVVLFSFLEFTAAAQDLLDYDVNYTLIFTSVNLRHGVQFEGQADTVVSIYANNIDTGNKVVSIEVRDAEDEIISFYGDYNTFSFAIAELPEDGLYTLILGVEEATEIEFMLRLSAFLNDGIDISVITDTDTPMIFPIRVEEEGDYTISYEHEGDIGTGFTLLRYVNEEQERILTVNGRSSRWNSTIQLDSFSTYVAIVGTTIFRGMDADGLVSIQVTQEE